MWGSTGERGLTTMNNEQNVSRLSADQVRVLMSDISPYRVKARAVDGRQQSYVMAWDVKTTLIRVFGFGGFSADVIDSKILQVYRAETHPWHINSMEAKRNPGAPKTPQVVAQATVRLTVFGIGPGGEDATYTETAIGANSGWDMGMTMDNAIKTAESDALKRAATYLGTQFGLSLYDNGSKNDVVRVMFNQEQREALGVGVSEPDTSVAEALSRATTAPVAPDDTFEQQEAQEGTAGWSGNPYE